MVTVLLMMAFAVFAALVLHANNQNKRDEIRLPIYIENLRARRRRNK